MGALAAVRERAARAGRAVGDAVFIAVIAVVYFAVVLPVGALWKRLGRPRGYWRRPPGGWSEPDHGGALGLDGARRQS